MTDLSMTALERAARAACQRLRLDPDEWLPVPGTGQGDYMTEPRWHQVRLAIAAALRALREPDEAMLAAMGVEMEEVNSIVVFHAVRTGQQVAYKDGVPPLTRAWQAAIDSILAGDER